MNSLNINLVALLETRVKRRNFLKTFQNCFGGWLFLNNYYVASNGRIWVTWNPVVLNVQLLVVHEQYLHLSIRHMVTGWTILVTTVYALNDAPSRAIA